MSEESVTCVAVKEDRHQNIMNSVALKKATEEPLTIERVVNYIDLHCYHEITLKSDIEPAIIAFRNCVAEMWKAEVTRVCPVWRESVGDANLGRLHERQCRMIH